MLLPLHSFVPVSHTQAQHKVHHINILYYTYVHTYFLYTQMCLYTNIYIYMLCMYNISHQSGQRARNDLDVCDLEFICFELIWLDLAKLYKVLPDTFLYSHLSAFPQSESHRILVSDTTSTMCAKGCRTHICVLKSMFCSFLTFTHL